MGDIGIIARRLSPDYVQYGWSGNGCNYKSLGSILLEYYNTPELVEYLFGLGQLSLLYTPYSEKENVWLRNTPTGKPHWVGQSEREIFSKIMFIDYGYFYDSDKRWYYVVPGPFRIKIPLELVGNNLDHSEYEFDFRNQEVQQQVIKKIHSIYETNEELRKRVNDAGLSDEQAREVISKCLAEEQYAVYYLYDHGREIFEQIDDWAVIKADENNKKIVDVDLRLKSDKHIETINWNG